MTPVQQLVADDRWTVVHGETADGPYVLRFRQPLLEPPAVHGYPQCLRVVWGYDAEGSGALPSSDASDRMSTFEKRLCVAWENDGLAALTAVLTFDGARQWVFYTSDVGACGARLNEMPQEAAPYPVELDAFDDSEWHYLRNDVVGERGAA